MKQTQHRILEVMMTEPTFDNLIPQQCKKTQIDNLKISNENHCSDTNFVMTRTYRSMTGTRKWEYINYPKPIVSLKKFLRFKIFISSIIKPYFKIFPSTILKIPSCISINFTHLIIQYHMLNINHNTIKIHFLQFTTAVSRNLIYNTYLI